MMKLSELRVASCLLFPLLTWLFATGCSDAKQDAASSSQPAATSESAPRSSGSAAPSESAAVPLPPAKPPVLKLVQAFPDQLKGYGSVHDVEGQLLLANANEVERVDGDKLVRIGEVIKHTPMAGPTTISWVGGHYPDAIDVVYSFANGRIPSPTYVPMTGKGASVVVGGGGGYGHIAGVAYRDGSAVMAGEDLWHSSISTVRGKTLRLAQVGRTKAGCSAKQNFWGEFLPAISPLRLASSKDGTIVIVGFHCTSDDDKSPPAVEMWPREGASKVIKLSEWQKQISSSTKLLAASDRFWISGGASDDPIVELKDGVIKPLPKLQKVVNVFLGPDATLYASDGSTIHRWVAGGESAGSWQAVATLAWSAEFTTLALHDGVFWGSIDGTIYKTEPTVPLELTADCKTPFVLLFDVKSEPGYSFPTTKKALAAFDRKKEIAMVEFREGNRRLGVKVPDRAAGEAVIALIKANMKDEDPKLVCYEPSTVLRTHPL